MSVRWYVVTTLQSLLLLYSPLLNGQPDDRWTASFFLENDLFANTDRNYTNGVRASLVSPDLDDFSDDAGRSFPLIDGLSRLLRPLHPETPRGETPSLNMVASIGQLMFTPADRDRRTLDPDDRPYAGWLYLGMGYHARTERRLNSVEFNIGLVGPASLAKESQDLVHDVRGIGRFKGWDHQLSNELGLRLTLERKYRLWDYSFASLPAVSTDVITHLGLSLGNIATYANTGAEWRIGYNLPKDFGTSSLKPGGDNSAPGRGDIGTRPLQLQAFVSTDLRGVMRNIFLDGNTFSDSHSVDKRTFVANVAVGVAMTHKRWRLSYAYVFRSKEFRGQPESQEYGAVSLAYSYPW